MGELLKFRLSDSHQTTSMYVPFDSSWTKLKSLAFGFLNVDYSKSIESIHIVDTNNMDTVVEIWDQHNFNFQTLDLSAPGQDLVFVIHLQLSESESEPEPQISSLVKLPPHSLDSIDVPEFTSTLASTVEDLLSDGDQDDKLSNDPDMELSSTMMIMNSFNVNTFKRLVSNEVPVNICLEYDKKSEFLKCCANGVTENILMHMADAVTAERLQGMLLASTFGHLAVVEILHKEGVSIDEKESLFDLTPLNGACIMGHEAVAKWFIDRECNVTKLSKFGACPLHYICYHGMSSLHSAISNPLADSVSEGGFSLIHYAAGMGSISTVEQLITVGVDVNTWDTLGNYPLHYSAASGVLEIVFLLVEVGHCHVDCVNENGQTPFLVACRAGQLEVAKWLGTPESGESTRGGGGANVFISDKEWCNAVHAAALSGNIDLISYVASLGVSVISKNKDGKTPIELTKDFGVITRLRELEAEKYLKDENITKKKANEVSSEMDERELSNGSRNQAERTASGQYKVSCDMGMNDNSCVEEFLPDFPEGMYEKKDKSGDGTGTDNVKIHPDPEVNKLFVSCLNGDNDYIEWYISRELDVDVCNENGSRPVHFATQSGNLAALQLLFEAGADLEAFNNKGVQPMALACVNLQPDDFSLIKWLASQGAEVFSGRDDIDYTKEPMFALSACPFDCASLIDFLFQSCPLLKYNIKAMNKSDELEWSMLHRAALHGPTANVEAFLSIGMKIGSRLSDTGYTVLMCAVLNPNPNVETVSLIVSHCEHDDVVAVDNTGRTAIFMACLIGNYEIATCIANAGFNSVAIPNKVGNTCLHVACQSGNSQLIEWLRTEHSHLDVVNNAGNFPQDYAVSAKKAGLLVGKNYSFLHNAFLTGNAKDLATAHSVFDLAEEALQIDPEFGYPFLNVMSMEGHIDAIAYLIEQGAPLNMLDFRGWSPLHCAAANGHTDLVRFFVMEQGMSLFDTCGDGSSCLHLAVRGNYLEMASTLLQLGADANCQDDEGNTPSHSAAAAGALDMIAILQENGADLCLKNGDLMSVLHVAVEGAAEVTDLEAIAPLIDQILNFGIDIDIRGRNNLTPFHLACLYGNVELCNYLFESGSNIRLTGGRDGIDAIHMAAVKDQLQIVEWLVTRGLRYDSINKDNKTAAEMAYTAGNHEIYDWLQTTAPAIYADRYAECLVSQLFWAIRLNYMTFAGILLQDFLDGSSTLHYCDDEGSTLMHAAAAVGNLAILEELFDRGVGIEDVNNNEHTPLHIATLHEHLGCVKALVNLGSDVKAKDSDGVTCLHIAVIKNNVDIAKLFCVLYDNVDIQNMSGWTPLHYCCYDGQNVDMLTMLLQQKSNPFQYSFDDETPFFLACKEGRGRFVYEMILCVAKKGVLVNEDTIGRGSYISRECGFNHVARWLDTIELKSGVICTPLPDSSSMLITLLPPQQSNSLSALKTALAPSENLEVFLEAVQNDDATYVEALLKAGVAANSFNPTNKMSALHYACLSGNLMIVQLLIGNGADMNAQNVGGLTPLHICCDRQHEDVAIYLLMMGASVMKLCNNGNSVVHMMASRCLCDSIYELKSRNKQDMCNLGSRNSLGQTALHLAVVAGSVDTCEALISLGCPIDNTDYEGQTPLLVACCIDNNALVTLLVTRGANVNLEDSHQKRPLHAACQTGNMLVAHSLIDASATVHCTTDTGDTLLHVCARYGKLLLLKWLVKLGLSLDSKNSDDQTPRDCAEINGNINITSWIDAV